MGDQDQAALAAEAYVYGYPLVFNLDSVLDAVYDGIGPLPAAPFNRFAHATRLAGPRERSADVSGDTVDSVAQVDLGAGPLLLRTPATGDRYMVLQFVDAWTNNFAYVGTRATGPGAAEVLLAGPGWKGTEVNAARRITFPTRVGTIVGRFACAGAHDLPGVAALQQRLALEPVAGPGPADAVPLPDFGIPEELTFFEKLRLWMAAFPPSEPEQAGQRRFAPLGLLEGHSPYLRPPTELAQDLRAGLREGRQRLERAVRASTGATVNGWRSAVHTFDYNLDHFEVGALDDPVWKVPDRQTARLQRAIAARSGLWGSHGYEAASFTAVQDADGAQLNGDHRYQLRFDQDPPAAAFWSLTMYDLPGLRLVDNPIGGSTIGDRTPGLRRGGDGSLTVLIQHHPPPHQEQANWLPAPDGDFRPTLRLYIPGKAVLDGTYQPPPVTRLG